MLTKGTLKRTSCCSARYLASKCGALRPRSQLTIERNTNRFTLCLAAASIKFLLPCMSVSMDSFMYPFAEVTTMSTPLNAASSGSGFSMSPATH